MLKLLKSKKVIIPVASLIFIFGILIYFSDRLTPFIVLNFLYSKTKTPEMYVVPITREAQGSAEEFSIHYVLSYKCIKFKVPWVLREKIELNRSTLFEFMNKKGLQIEQQVSDERILKGLLVQNPAENQKTKLLFGEENLESEYAIVNLILHTTPDQASLLKPLPELVRVHPLLLYKMLYSHLGDVIYKFGIDDLKGFQFANPQNTENVRVHLFNEKDEVFKLHFIRATQAEIDYILSTIDFSKSYNKPVEQTARR